MAKKPKAKKSGKTRKPMSAEAKAKLSRKGKARWAKMSASAKAAVKARLSRARALAKSGKGGSKGGSKPKKKASTSKPSGSPSSSSGGGSTASNNKKSGGIGKWMRRIRMGADATAGAVGIALADDGDSLRGKASRAMERYIGVGLDGQINTDALINNASGIVTASIDDWVKRKTHHYQLIGQQHILPTAGEAVPYLFAWDAAGIPGTAREKAIAAHDCFVESTDGYVPSTGEYKGINSDKLRAYLLGSHGGRIGSRIVTRFFPDVQSSIRDLFGWSA